MSFSSEIKNALALNKDDTKAETIAEILGHISGSGSIKLSSEGMTLILSYENLRVAKRVFNMIESNEIKCDINILDNKLKKSNSYELLIGDKENLKTLINILGFDDNYSLFAGFVPQKKMLKTKESKISPFVLEIR